MEENASTPERIAQNDATFRRANEGISETAEEYEITEGLLPFLCECADPSCTVVMQLTRSEYEEIRSDGAYFLNVPGHDAASEGETRVVKETERYLVVEKLGHAGEVSRREDPRQAAVAEEQNGVA